MNITLSETQQLVFDKFLDGDNIFLTGPGGTGKTKLIQCIVDEAVSQNKRFQLCSLTGCSAILLKRKAKTIHSWAGVGLLNGSIEKNVEKVCNNKYKRKNWLKTDILIVDEVSMMSLKLFEVLDKIGRIVKKKDIPFGGIQLIFSGDFFQLPPVPTRGDKKSGQFCFESDLWDDTFDCQIELKEIFRQNDIEFIKILLQIRMGKITKNSINVLNKLVGKEITKDIIIKPTRLYPLRKMVSNLNEYMMNSIETELYEYSINTVDDITNLTDKNRLLRSKYSKKEIEFEYNYLMKNINCEQNLKLKVGAQVMSIVNYDLDCEAPICNGSQGIIVDIMGGLPVVKFQNGIVKTISRHVWESENIPGIGVSQIPLILSWAITIHKSQGVTLDYAEIDIGSGIFECGQTYVALSRVKNLEGVFLKSFDFTKIKVNKKVYMFYDKMSKMSKNIPKN